MVQGTEVSETVGALARWRRLRNPLDPGTTLGRRRILGIVLMIPLFAYFFQTNRFPKLDRIRDEVQVATREGLSGTLPSTEFSRCFQGFCFGEEAGLLQRWWDFSINYIDLVTVGMIFAFLVAGIADALLFPGSVGGAFGKRGLRGSLQGLVVGPVVMLCSACIVPVANSLRKKGATIEATIAVTQSSSTLNAPALIMLVAIFSPVLWASRLALSIAGVLLLGPFVAWLVEYRHRGDGYPGVEGAVRLQAVEEAVEESPEPWATIVAVGLREWLASAWRFFIRLAPIMVIAGFVAGFAIQFLTEDGVATFLGNHLLGVLVAATIGVLINVPLLFEIPLVAGLMLLGAGVGPAATLLFAAAAGGPITYWGLAGQMGRRASAWLAVATWGLAVVGGVTVIGWTSAFPARAAIPTVAFDGAACSYRGPESIEPGTHTFRFESHAGDTGSWSSMTVIVGRLPDGGSVEGLASDLDRRGGRVPSYVAVAAEYHFLLAGSAHLVDVPIDRAGTYAAMCLRGADAGFVHEVAPGRTWLGADDPGGGLGHLVAVETFEVVGG